VFWGIGASVVDALFGPDFMVVPTSVLREERKEAGFIDRGFNRYSDPGGRYARIAHE